MENIHIAPTYSNLGAAHYQNGQYQIAKPLFERALELQVNVYGEDHPSTNTICDWMVDWPERASE
jgi:Tfp pilus assembly protein PilF